MATPAEMLRQGRTDELWQRYLGFLDLSLEEFMTIQKRKVVEQAAWLSQCELGQKIIGPRVPSTVEEFREWVPLSTYSDYAPFLQDQRTDALPEEPIGWMRTSGRGGEEKVKWAPMFKETYEHVGRRDCTAVLAMAASRHKGDFRIGAGDKLPFMWAPSPFALGNMARAVTEELPLVVMPSLDVGTQMEFQDRIETALNMSLRNGMDHFFGLSSVLVKVGERFAEQSSEKRGFSRDMLDPRVLWRLIRGMIRSKSAGRPMYPKDLWDVKGVSAGGTDTSIFADRIEKYWGVKPIEMYGSSEFGVKAIQTWGRGALTPLPEIAFFEFIPLEESHRSRTEPRYQPSTLLLDEVQAGETYEIVMTSLKLTPFTRYRIGDMVRIDALRSEEYDIDIPQIIVEGRCDDVIDLAGFTRLSERAIWYAIENSGVPYEEWLCRKELEGDNPILRLWVELKADDLGPDEVREAVHESLKQLDSDYRDLESMLGYNPMRVHLLSNGTFHRYMLNRQAAGAEPAHFKPRHFVHAQDELDLVLALDAEGQ